MRAVLGIVVGLVVGLGLAVLPSVGPPDAREELALALITYLGIGAILAFMIETRRLSRLATLVAGLVLLAFVAPPLLEMERVWWRSLPDVYSGRVAVLEGALFAGLLLVATLLAPRRDDTTVVTTSTSEYGGPPPGPTYTPPPRPAPGSMTAAPPPPRPTTTDDSWTSGQQP